MGDFRADILAKDGETVVVVENQFGRTDHDHLGKLLVYAAGLQATVVVWIAERLRPEHREVLDWLNENTPEGLGFFGLELELWRIGESPAAPKFNVVSNPNNWTKAVRQVSPESPRRAEQLQFWQGFAEHVEDAGLPLRLAPQGGRYYQNVRLGRAGYQISLQRLSRDREIACELRMNRDAEKKAFDELAAQRSEIEAITGPLEWLRQPETQVSKVVVRRPADPSDSAQWSEMYKWLGEKATEFQRAFQPRLPEASWNGDAGDAPIAEP